MEDARTKASAPDAAVAKNLRPLSNSFSVIPGARFALMEAKLSLAHMVNKYRFEPTASTPSCLRFRPGQLMMNCYEFELAAKER